MENLVTEGFPNSNNQTAADESKFEVDKTNDVIAGGNGTDAGEQTDDSNTKLQQIGKAFNLSDNQLVNNNYRQLSDINLESNTMKRNEGNSPRANTGGESELPSLTDEERMTMYEKAVEFKRLGNANHSLLCFLDCLRGLQPGGNSKFVMLPQCLTHVAQLYAHYEDYQRAVEFMLAAKLYYEIAIIETGVQVDEYQRETDSGYRPLDLDPCLDEAKRANEYEKLSYSCLEKEKFQLALDYCGKATKLRQQVYGDEHPITGKTVDLFTLIYAEMGKSQYTEALKKHGELEKAVLDGEEKKGSDEKQSGVESDSVKEESKKTDITTTAASTVSEESIKESQEQVSMKSKKKVSFADSVPEVTVNDNCSDRISNNDNNGDEYDQNKDESNNYISENKNIEEKDSVNLITPKQFLFIFIFSATVSIFLTCFWCWLFESDSCPSRHYIKRTLKYLYYYYFVPHTYA